MMLPPRTSKETKEQRKLSGKTEDAQNEQTAMTKRAVYSAAKGVNLANFMAIALTVLKNNCENCGGDLVVLQAKYHTS